jgi:hypothetical protein
MKASLITYDFRELHKKSDIKIVKSGCVRFGGHVEREVSYKILWLDLLKETQNLHNLSCFE